MVDLFDVQFAEKHEMERQIKIGLETSSQGNQQPVHTPILFINRITNR